jgi:Recombination directionality factor-like
VTIITLQRRLHESGRIRIGTSVPAKSRHGKDIRRPVKLDRFRFTSANERALQVVAELWGGVAEVWEEAPVGKQWQVITDARTIPVLVPPETMAFSQAFEAWEGGGCVRRCDGERMIPSEHPCECDPEDRTCKPTTRLSLLLPQLPGSGLWRLEVHGYAAAAELQSAFDMAQILVTASGKEVLPAHLSLTEREIRRPDKPLARFIVPILDFDLGPSLASLTAGSSLELGQPAAALPAAPAPGLTPIPPALPSTLREELESIDTTPPPSTRANAAEPIKRTGLAPRTAAQAAQASAPSLDNEPAPAEATPAHLADLLTMLGTLTDEQAAHVKTAWRSAGLPAVRRIRLLEDAVAARTLIELAQSLEPVQEPPDDGETDREPF